MSRDDTSNFAFLADQEPLLHQIGATAEAAFYTDSNVTLVKLRQLAEHLTRNAAARLGVVSDAEENFFSLIASLKSQIDVDEKVIRLLHHLRKSGNEAVHEYKDDQVEAGRALRSAREACIWYYRTFCSPHPGFRPGPFVQPRNWKQEEEDLRAIISRLEAELERERKDSEKNGELVRNLKEQEDRLRALVNERTLDAEASLSLAEEQEKKLQTLIADYEDRLAEMASFTAGNAHAATTIAERSKRASEHIEAEWAPSIRLRDAFDGHQLTANQEILVLELEAFLTSKEEHVFILSGHAGTGKTFITRGLSEFFAATGRGCVITAPTGKAARVITQKSGRLASTIHSKIYSMNDIKEYRVEEIDGSETFKFYADLEVNIDADNTVYIIDESSMVSDVYSEGEFFRFGSGQLLSDLMKYVNLDHNDHNKKIIFIGDSAQLPPVGMSFSPALDHRYLTKTFGINEIRRFELSQVVRQDADSGILSAANALRDSLSRNNFSKLSLKSGGTDVHICSDAGELVTDYLSASGNKVNDVAMIIASSNAEVATFNEQVRNHLFPAQECVTRGDKLVIVMNCRVGSTPLNNGDLVYVVGVESTSETRSVTIKNKNKSTGKVDETEVSLQFKDIQIAFRMPDGKVIREHVKIVESLLYSSHPNLSSDETKALYIDFRRRNPDVPRSGPVLKEALLADKYYKALRVKFGYALTCHKAQGSEWPDVFVSCKAYMDPRTEEYFRWLYTAITRASSGLHLLDPPDLNPWQKLRPVRDHGGARPPSPPPKTFPIAPKTDGAATPHEPAAQTEIAPSDETGSSPSIASTGDPVLDGIYQAVSTEIAALPGIRVDRIDHHSWQEAYYISDGTRFTRINIAYNAKGIVGSIIPVPRDDFGSEITNRLSEIKGLQLASQNPSGAQDLRFTRDVFNDFFPVFSEAAASSGLQIVGVTEESWNLRVVLATATARGELAIYCDGKGNISKHFWIGRPPQDPSLHQALEATMANL